VSQPAALGGFGSGLEAAGGAEALHDGGIKAALRGWL
jgi:hypothetical protein